MLFDLQLEHWKSKLKLKVVFIVLIYATTLRIQRSMHGKWICTIPIKENRIRNALLNLYRSYPWIGSVLGLNSPEDLLCFNILLKSD